MNPQEVNTLQDLKTSIEGIDKRLEKIEVALVGDPELGNDGFVKRLRKLEIDQVKTQSKIDKVFWTASVVGALVAFIVSILGLYFK